MLFSLGSASVLVSVTLLAAVGIAPASPPAFLLLCGTGMVMLLGAGTLVARLLEATGCRSIDVIADILLELFTGMVVCRRTQQLSVSYLRPPVSQFTPTVTEK